MAFTVRSLLPKVQVFRKDLEEERAIFAIQEAVRKVCRMTGYAKATATTTTVALNPIIDMSNVIDATQSVYRVHLVRLFDTKLNEFKVLYEYNQMGIDNQEAYRNYSVGWPSGWTYGGGGLIQIYPNPDLVYTLEITYSFIPVGEIDVIPLPEESEEAVIAGALSFILMQPGPGQNLQLAKDREVLHNREMDFLKANALLGQSGRPRATGRTLATRAIRMWDNRWQ